MRGHQHTLYVGAPRGTSCPRTLEVIVGKLRRLGKLAGARLLDVGCGDGTFTVALGRDFEEVHGIDVQESYLDRFRQAVAGDRRFFISNMSGSKMSFPTAHFDSVVTVETLEHVPDLPGTAAEICRVLKPGGELLMTVPNRWFPFENHGMRIGPWNIGRVPLLPYFPWLHRQLAQARVFTVRDLDSLFTPALKRVAVDYAWPTFEHGGNRLQPLLKPLFGMMRRLERSRLRLFGSSVVVRYVRP